MTFKKKLLFIIAERTYGLTTLLVNQAISIHKSDTLESIFVSGVLEQESLLFDKLKKNNIIPLIVNGLNSHSNFIQLVSEFKTIIDNNKPDIIHVQTNWQLTIIAFIKVFYCRRFKIVYTIHAFRHNHKIKSYFARLIIGSALFAFVSKIIVCSTYTRDKFKLLAYKTDIIYLGIDDEFLEKRDNNDIEVGRIITICFPGEFRIGKNQELIIESCAKFLNEFPNRQLKLILPGDGNLKSVCIELASTLGIAENVKFPGRLSTTEIVKIFKESSIAVIPTNSETFGLCIAEPFAYGRCVISRNVGVAPDIIENGKNGFLFSNNNEFYPIFKTVLLDKDLIRECGNLAFSNRMIFNWNTISKEYCKIINSI